jgi:hypothetical protein
VSLPLVPVGYGDLKSARENSVAVPVADPGRKQRWTREKYNAYQREYMRIVRKKRAK